MCIPFTVYTDADQYNLFDKYIYGYNIRYPCIIHTRTMFYTFFFKIIIAILTEKNTLYTDYKRIFFFFIIIADFTYSNKITRGVIM